MQALADRLDRHVVRLPKRQHHEILRIGETDRRQQRCVNLVHRMQGRIKGEADQLVDSRRVVVVHRLLPSRRLAPAAKTISYLRNKNRTIKFLTISSPSVNAPRTSGPD